MHGDLDRPAVDLDRVDCPLNEGLRSGDVLLAKNGRAQSLATTLAIDRDHDKYLSFAATTIYNEYPASAIRGD